MTKKLEDMTNEEILDELTGEPDLAETSEAQPAAQNAEDLKHVLAAQQRQPQNLAMMFVAPTVPELASLFIGGEIPEPGDRLVLTCTEHGVTPEGQPAVQAKYLVKRRSWLYRLFHQREV